MIQGVSLNNQSKFSAKSVPFAHNSVPPQDKKIGTVQPQKDGNILMTSLMLGGAAAAGVLGHKIYVSRAAGASEAKDGALAAAETLHKIVVKDFDKTALHAKFQESNKSLLGFIQEAQAKPEEMKEFLFGITSYPEKADEFVKEVTQDPRKSQSIVKTLVQKVGGQKNFVDWYFAPQGYQTAYKKHMEKAFEVAKTPEELLRMSPNWHYHLLVSKFGKDFTVGQLPQGIDGLSKYREAVKSILKGANDALPNGIKKIQDFTPGMSDKRAFLIEAGDKKYVLKIHHDNEEYSPALKKVNDELRQGEDTSWLGEKYFDKIEENQHMKSDSAFINAQLDFYLKSHNCTDSPNIHFFDAKTKSSLYEVAEGEPITIEEAQILDANKKMTDLNSLGIIYNDINNGNFRVKDGKVKTIDSGESSYIDVLRPGCSGYNFKLPNWNGMDLPSCLAGMNLDKI